MLKHCHGSAIFKLLLTKCLLSPSGTAVEYLWLLFHRPTEKLVFVFVKCDIAICISCYIGVTFMSDLLCASV